MSETLILRLPEADRPAAWIAVDALGNRIGDLYGGTLAEATPFAKGRYLRVCVPSADVVLLHADVPTRSASKVLQAIPFAVEDHLAEDVETLHFALGQRTAQGYLVAAVARTRMQQWLDELAAADLVPAELVPDVLAMPMREHNLVLIPDGDRILARLPDGAGISASHDLLPLLIRQYLERLPETERCTGAVVYGTDEQASATLEALAASLQLPTERAPLPSGTVGLLGVARLPAQAINLLQGEFGRSNGPREYWQRWRIAALLLAGLIVVLIAQQAVSGFKLQRESAHLNAEVAALFHQALPDVTRMVDPKAQMRQRLARVGGGIGGSTDLLSLLAIVGKTLQSHPGVQLQGLSYHNSVLQLQVQTGNISTLDTLKSALQQTASLHANLDSVSSKAGQTTGRLTISGAAS